MRLQFIGCGDAFGSGGRANTCFHVTGERTNFLFDCGATALPAMKSLGIDRNAIDTILITHFHADHFGGIPFFVLDAMYIAKRTRPLLIAGPQGLGQWYSRAIAAAFPGDRNPQFPLTLRELMPGREHDVGGMRVTPRAVDHDNLAGPCLTYRVEAEGKAVSYSGDTEWVEALEPSARGADLFVCECYAFNGAPPTHMSYKVLRDKLPGIGAKRVVLTHMSEEMLARLGEVKEETAKDGMTVEF
jgi:ribonuclease BN (tRNA processing enzyme)